MSAPKGLLKEYNLSFQAYKMLKLLSEERMLYFYSETDRAKMKSISHNPAPILRSLVRKGLADGPEKGEPLTYPFRINNNGKTVLQKIKIGLHRPVWLSLTKVEILKLLSRRCHTPAELKRKFHKMFLLALEGAGYIKLMNGSWHITGTGQRALTEYEMERQND